MIELGSLVPIPKLMPILKWLNVNVQLGSIDGSRIHWPHFGIEFDFHEPILIDFGDLGSELKTFDLLDNFLVDFFNNRFGFHK
jgi:hypothetical protein